MAIENPIVDAGPTVPLRKVVDQPILISTIGPGQTGSYVDEEGSVQTITRTPRFEGECMIFQYGTSSASNDTVFFMYCVVTINSVLTWAKVQSSDAFNQYREPWDPMNPSGV